MSLQPSDLILYPSRVTAAECLAALASVLGWENITQQDRDFAVALEEACDESGVDLAFAYAHGANEAKWYTDSDFTDDNNGFGIAHPDNATSGTAFPTVRACARMYVVELLLKMRQPVPGSLADVQKASPKRYAELVAIVSGSLGPFPAIARIRDLNTPFGPNNREAVWMTDENGPEAICDKGNRLFPNLPTQTSSPAQPTTPKPTPGSGGTVKTYSTMIPGLPGGPLVTTYPINILLIPTWRTNNRPGYIARLPRRSVQHGNGNPNSSAAGEARYVYNGAEGRQASYHSTTDDIETWVMLPANEVSWQAADNDGPGNYNGYSNELVEDDDIWNDPVRARRCIAIAGDFMGRAAARLDIEDPEQHWTFNYNNAPNERHDCPNKLRHRYIYGVLAWNLYVADWRAAKADERKRMAGPVATPVPIPSTAKFPVTRKPVKAPGSVSYKGLANVVVRVGKSRSQRCTHGTTPRTYPSRRAPAAVKTPYRRGRVYLFRYETTIDGEEWLVSTAGSFALKKAFEAID